MTFTTGKQPLTDFGPRLCSDDPEIHAKALAELSAKGDQARVILLAELEQRTKDAYLSAFPVLAMAVVPQLPKTFELLAQGPPSWSAFNIIRIVFFLSLTAFLPWKIRFGFRQNWAQRRALALTLAGYDDPQVLPGLLQLAPLKPGTSPEGDDLNVLRELTRLLGYYLCTPYKPPLAPAFEKRLYKALNHLYPAPRPLRTRVRTDHARRVADFSDTQADLLATIAQVLAASPSPTHRRLLERMANAETPAQSNRRFVQEVAQVLTGLPIPPRPMVVPSKPLMTLSPPPAVVPLTLKRP